MYSPLDSSTHPTDPYKERTSLPISTFFSFFSSFFADEAREGETSSPFAFNKIFFSGFFWSPFQHRTPVHQEQLSFICFSFSMPRSATFLRLVRCSADLAVNKVWLARTWGESFASLREESPASFHCGHCRGLVSSCRSGFGHEKELLDFTLHKSATRFWKFVIPPVNRPIFLQRRHCRGLLDTRPKKDVPLSCALRALLARRAQTDQFMR